MSPPRPRPGGMFLTFEGIEGSGKSTQIRRLARRLETAGIAALVTREPGGTALGRRLRSALLDPGAAPPSPLVELLLYTADRAQHLTEVVEPALDAGRVVLCDRYLDATLAYQGAARGLGAEAVERLHREPPLDRRPLRTVLLDADPAESLARARERNRSLGTARSEGRFEDEDVAFHESVRRAYLALAAASPSRFRIVHGMGSEEEVEARVILALADLFPSLAEPRP